MFQILYIELIVTRNVVNFKIPCLISLFSIYIPVIIVDVGLEMQYFTEGKFIFSDFVWSKSCPLTQSKMSKLKCLLFFDTGTGERLFSVLTLVGCFRIIFS